MTQENDEPILASQRALEPEQEGHLTFQGRTIRTATMANSQGYVVLRSLCEAFDLVYDGQRQRLYRSDLFRRYSALVSVQTPTRGRQAMLSLSAFAVPAFLMGVDTARVASEISRELLDTFQEEGMILLAEHFGLSERGEIRFLRESVTRMVIQQEAFEEQVVKNVEKELAADRAAREEKIQQIRDAFGKMREQIRGLEKSSGPRVRITPEQLGQLRQTVMVLGEMMIMADENKKPWPAIYTGIAMQFGFSRSEDITQEVFPEVLQFLDRQVTAFRQLLLSKGKDENA
jgi:beta-phosphoglucomutase-like phosphatase (HAD superfamily)